MRAHVPLIAACLLIGAIINVLIAWACDRWLVDPAAPAYHQPTAAHAWPGPVPAHWPQGPFERGWSVSTSSVRGLGWSTRSTSMSAQ